MSPPSSYEFSLRLRPEASGQSSAGRRTGLRAAGRRVYHSPTRNRRIARVTPETLLDRVLYRDSLILVIDKPSGLPVHAGPSGGDNLERHLDALRFGLAQPPALAHRLDRDTSGCLVLGRSPKAMRRLGRLFSAGQVAKTYWAVVVGQPPSESGVIDAPLAKATSRAGWRMAVTPGGARAVTRYRVRGRSQGMAWLELSPETGRTHQIRVHLAHIGCPVVGDPHYGRGEDGCPMHLHARALAIPLRATRPPVAVEAEPPAHMRVALAACGWSPAVPAA